jgi:hypothetical protein
MDCVFDLMGDDAWVNELEKKNRKEVRFLMEYGRNWT